MASADAQLSRATRQWQLGELVSGQPGGASPSRLADVEAQWRNVCCACKLYTVGRTIEIQAGRQTITAADPLPGDLRQALDALTRDN